MLFLASMGKTDSSMTFSKFLVWSFEVVEVEQCLRWILIRQFRKISAESESLAANLEKANLYMKPFHVSIYFTLLYFIFYYALVSNAKGHLEKSNKSELWTICQFDQASKFLSIMHYQYSDITYSRSELPCQYSNSLI